MYTLSLEESQQVNLLAKKFHGLTEYKKLCKEGHDVHLRRWEDLSDTEKGLLMADAWLMIQGGVSVKCPA